MTTVFQIHADELSEKIMDAIKTAFKNKEIIITVVEASDDTHYLLSGDHNKQHLLKSVQEIEEGKGVTMTLEELQQTYGNQ